MSQGLTFSQKNSKNFFCLLSNSAGDLFTVNELRYKNSDNEKTIHKRKKNTAYLMKEELF